MKNVIFFPLYPNPPSDPMVSCLRLESELTITIVPLLDPLKGWYSFQVEIKCLRHTLYSGTRTLQTGVSSTPSDDVSRTTFSCGMKELKIDVEG
jgi:hypothetical protein